MVLVHHFIIWTQIAKLGGTWTEPSIDAFNNFGAGGVALFFMTTGLVFYPRVLAGFARTSWPATFVSRVFRIMPLLAVSVAVVTLIIMARTGQRLNADFWRGVLVWLSSWRQPPLLERFGLARNRVF